jgi:hypothetical protein
LSILEEGYCIIRVNSIKEPFLLGVPFIKRGAITVSDITRKNQGILDKLDLKTEKIHKSKDIIRSNHSWELNNKRKESLLSIDKNRSLSKIDYDNFNAFINKLYNNQKKNK